MKLIHVSSFVVQNFRVENVLKVKILIQFNNVFCAFLEIVAVGVALEYVIAFECEFHYNLRQSSFDWTYFHFQICR
jgi:hypothetical protein